MIECLFQCRRRAALLLLPAAALLLASTGLWAEPQPRNDTGQTTCFNIEGQPIDCTDQEFPGQDGAIGRDRAASLGDLPKTGGGAAGFDFTKIANNGAELPANTPLGGAPGDWACTRDNVTGMIWEVKTDVMGPRYKQLAFAWYNPNPGNGGNPGEEFDTQLMCNFMLPCNTQAYVDYVNSIQLCGLGDWRLPTRDELVTIVHFGADANYAVDEGYFTRDVVPVWTVDTALEPEGGDFAMTVNFVDGHVEAAPKGGGAVTPMLVNGTRFVSKGEPPSCGKRENPEIFPSTAGAFMPEDEGLVRDNRTELVWDRCSIGQDSSGEAGDFHCDGEAQPMSWAEALQRVRELNEQAYKGHDDWRLPNIKELQSIVERRCAMPVLDTVAFPNQNPEPLWSSTTSRWMQQGDSAWVLQMEMGHMMTLPKQEQMRIRVVRGGSGYDDYQGPTAYRIGGTVSGMVGNGLVLKLQAGTEDTLVIDANGEFHFALGLPDGTPYAVTVDQAPVPEQSCSVANGSGTVAGAHVGNVEVTCAPPPPAIIEATPTQLSFAVSPGTPAQGTLSIANRGGGILHWAIDTAYAAGRTPLADGAVVDCSATGELIVHDDGTAENGYGGGSNWVNGLVLVERFVPLSYPASIRAICLPLTAQGASAAAFEIVVFRDNGPNGAPGAELGSMRVDASGIPTYPVAQPQWFAYDLSSLYTTIDSGGLYIGLRGLPTTPNLFLLVDESEGHPVGYGEGYWKRNGVWQRLADVPGFPNYRSTLMRAAQGAAQELPVGCSDPHTVPWLSLDRHEGQTNAGDTSAVQVSINSAGLADGDYHALLCIESDGSADVVQVPVNLSVASQHTVTPSAGANGSISPSTPQTVEHGQTVSFTLAADAGWHIADVGGTCGGNLAGSVFTTAAVTADCTVMANFAIDPVVTHTVTPSAGAHGSIDPSTPQTVEHGQTVSFTLAADAGWHIANVGGTCGGTLAGNQFTTAAVTADCTVMANFEIDPVVTHTVTPSAGAHGSITPSTPQAVEHGQTVSFTVAADAGWHLAGVDGSCGGSLAGSVFTTAPVTADCTVVANFKIDPVVTHTVTPSAGAHGSISPSTPQTIEHGQTVSFSVAADAGWRIANVGGSCGGTLAGSMFTTAPVTADCTVEASFEPDGDHIFTSGFDS